MKRWHIWIFATIGMAAMVAGLAAVNRFARLHAVPSTQRPDMPDVKFYGLVIDDENAPVVGARVSAILWTVPPGTPAPKWPSGNDPPPPHAQHISTLETDAQGRFSLEGKGYVVQIISVRKGTKYRWVTDFDWDWVRPPTVKRPPNNRRFVYGGDFPIYLPDKSRPAIFPLHLRTSGHPVRLLSRGGSDQLAEGTIIRNEPMKLLVPSTGPGAPKTVGEGLDRVHQLHGFPTRTRPAATQTSGQTKEDGR
jgi:hypothetical protein